ncbi:hypothetical protein EVAR_69838_1 [Eumeta japonica]|uniref:Uncharacterized protein n=1 Tax=Eumeta variegata TaxID=151549 RepID=A0A4C2A0H4_EUMVA|nr:hypothetical protein EVAR_69838_1 [Eumeta japonica]
MVLNISQQLSVAFGCSREAIFGWSRTARRPNVRALRLTTERDSGQTCPNSRLRRRPLGRVTNSILVLEASLTAQPTSQLHDLWPLTSGKRAGDFFIAVLRGKRACDPPKNRRSPPPMNSQRCVASSWIGIGCLMNEGVG